MGWTVRENHWSNEISSTQVNWEWDVELERVRKGVTRHGEDDLQLPVLTPSSMLNVNSNVLPELHPHHFETADLRERHCAQETARGNNTPAVGDTVIVTCKHVLISTYCILCFVHACLSRLAHLCKCRKHTRPAHSSRMK